MFADNERSPVLMALLNELDFRDLSKWDEHKLTVFRSEMRDCLRRPGSFTRMAALLDGSLKMDLLPMSYEELLVALVRISSFSAGEALGFVFCETLSQNKALSAAARRILRMKVGDVRSAVTLNDMPEELRLNFLNFIQTDEEFKSTEGLALFLAAAKESLASKHVGDSSGLVSKISDLMKQQISLSQLLEEYGPQTSASVDSFLKALHSSGSRIDEEQTAALLIMVLSKPFVGGFDEKRLDQWNLEVVADVMQQECRGLNWILVAKHLDNPRLSIRSENDFQLLARLFVRISGGPIPAAGLLSSLWANRTAQFIVLTLAANSPRNIVDFAPLVGAEQIISGDNVIIPMPPNLSWLCLPLYARMFDLAAAGLAMDVLEVLAKAAALFPEYVLTSLALVQDQSGVRNELLQRLLPSFTGIQGSKPTSLIVMRKLYSTNPDLLLKLCLVGFKRCTKVSEVVNLENIVKSLGAVALRKLEAEGSVDELLSYWCVKSDRQELNFEEKLLTLLEQNTKNCRLFVNFVKQNIETLRPRQIQTGDGLLSFENCSLLLRAAQPFPSIVSPEEIKSLAQIYNQLHQQNSGQHGLSGLGPSGVHREGLEGDLGRISAGPETEEVENLANAYFQKIYTTDISIMDVIALLRQFKSSSEKKDQEIFRCMIHNLFDEYRFFHKYPEKELLITGRLFGALIQNQLVSSITLGIALRYVLEALKKDPELGEGNDKMFRFGQIALDQFRPRLPEWPQYCSHLIQIPHLSRHNQDLYQEAQRALSNPQTVSQSSSSTPAASVYEVSSQASSNVLSPVPIVVSQLDASSKASESLISITSIDHVPNIVESTQQLPEIERMLRVNEKVSDDVVPPESIRDQIHMIVNNIAKNNLEVKATELREILKSEYFGWFATYLVEKRVSSQPNLHSLYLTLLEACDFSDLNKLILDCTYYNVTKFLSSSGSTTSTTERSFIRHFGMWLGQLTLARNKPLLQKRIDLKRLLQWGYENGRLIAVCPFVAKVIESVKDSKVFRPPNPWVAAVLGLLKELYELEDLKLNIKFEVQVLCKNINVKIEDVPKTSILSKCNSPTLNNNPDFNFKNPPPTLNPAVPQPPTAPAVTPVVPESSSKSESAIVAGSAFTVEALNSVISQVSSNAVVNPGLQYFVNNPTQRRIVSVAVERGIKEIMHSAVERSVAIAVATTKNLILKDFTTEPNESTLKNAAHAMVSCLTGSLALATCKEPLRLSIGNHLRSLLAPSVSDQALIEQLVQVCSNDNVELASTLIEKVSVERSLKDIDESLSVSYQNRKKARDNGQIFVDPIVNLQQLKLPSDLIEMLKPNPSGLTTAQLKLYEGFSKSKLSSLSAGSSVDVKALSTGSLGFVSMSQALEAYQSIYSRMDIALKNLQTQLQGREVTLNMLGDHEVIQLLREIVSLTQRIQTPLRNETAMTFSETIFNRLFEPMNTPDPLRLEVFVSIIEAVRDACGGSKAFSPDIIGWLGKYGMLVGNDEMSRKVYRHILLLLLRAKLFRPQDVDLYLAVNIDGGRNLFWLEVALSFVKQCLLENLGTVFDYTNTLDAVTKMRPTNMMLKKQLQKWITEIKAIATAQDDQRAGSSSVGVQNALTLSRDSAVREQVTMLLDRWLRIWNSINDEVFRQFLQLMHQCGVLKTEEAADRFFKVSVEVCVEASSKFVGGSIDVPGPINYSIVDALSKLFLLFVRLADKESSDANARLVLLTRILNAVLKSLLEDFENKKTQKLPFDQRAYFRLFSNLMHDLAVPDPKQEVNAVALHVAMAYTQIYLQLQPSVVPAFAFAWIQLISKRNFLPHLLRNQKGWPLMHRLLNGLLSFLQPFLKNAQLPDVIKKLYKGTLRLMLVMLHDFPEFLCDFHLSFCDLIPMNCVQLRNIVLSAFPRSIRLPDPFSANLKMDLIPESSVAPRILIDYLAPISNIRSHLDNYLSNGQPVDLPIKLSTLLLTNGSLNVALVTSVVIYTASCCVSQNKGPILSSSVDLLKQLCEAFDAENRCVFINVLVNQLRFPNSHTTFFSMMLLNLFAESKDEYVQEQITTILLERLVVHKPHPWGLLVTFIELIRNPRFAFWRKAFARSSPEIERIFDSIARSCISPSVVNKNKE